jgi:hypothetical protein
MTNTYDGNISMRHLRAAGAALPSSIIRDDRMPFANAMRREINALYGLLACQSAAFPHLRALDALTADVGRLEISLLYIADDAREDAAIAEAHAREPGPGGVVVQLFQGGGPHSDPDIPPVPEDAA